MWVLNWPDANARDYRCAVHRRHPSLPLCWPLSQTAVQRLASAATLLGQQVEAEAQKGILCVMVRCAWERARGYRVHRRANNPCWMEQRGTPCAAACMHVCMRHTCGPGTITSSVAAHTCLHALLVAIPTGYGVLFKLWFGQMQLVLPTRHLACVQRSANACGGVACMQLINRNDWTTPTHRIVSSHASPLPAPPDAFEKNAQDHVEAAAPSLLQSSLDLERTTQELQVR